ncbi:Uncharacterised protein [Mycobacteroides abscessus subsp. bolletii]|nr:Uncharacterised protein [Mycobacteroides abscessus subsp. bolletii]
MLLSVITGIKESMSLPLRKIWIVVCSLASCVTVVNILTRKTSQETLLDFLSMFGSPGWGIDSVDAVAYWLLHQSPTEMIRTGLFYLAISLVFLAGWKTTGYGACSSHVCIMFYAFVTPFSVPDLIILFIVPFLLMLWGTYIWGRNHYFRWSKPLIEFFICPLAWVLALLELLSGRDKTQSLKS